MLIERLHDEFGLQDSALAWLRSGENDRRQFVKLGSHLSSVTTCHAGVPQGSVLGPLLFAAYVSPVGELIASFGINYHQFADDLQMYVGLVATNVASTMSQLTACTAAVRHWFLLNGLQLNASKSEAMMLGTAAQLKSVGTAVRTVDIAGTSLPLIEELKTLGVIFDSHLRFDKHAAAVIRACSYHLRALRYIRNALPDDVAKCIGCSIVGAKLDYCNSLLYGSPVSTLDKLQRVQNQLARIVTKSDWRVDAMPIQRKLHWLPIRQRITFKLAVHAYKVHATATPEYLASLLQPYDTGRDYTYHGHELRPPSAPSPWRHLMCGTRCQTQFASVTAFRRLSADLKLILLHPLLINLPVGQAPLLIAHAGFYGAIKVLSYRKQPFNYSVS